MVTEISDWNELNDVRNDLTANYILTNDLDDSTNGYDTHVNTTDGWDPIGVSFDGLTGEFDGDGHTISDLFIDRSEDYVGLFADIEGNIKNVTLTDADVTGTGFIASVLVGDNRGTISDATVNGDLDCSQYGGLIAGQNNNSGVIKNSDASGTVTGSSNTFGGICGENFGGKITSCSADVSVSGGGNTAGVFCGSNQNGGTIKFCEATGDIDISNGTVGGFAGSSFDSGSEIVECFSDCPVDANDGTGGFIGDVSGGSVVDSYSHGDVTGSNETGGFVGRIDGTIERAYSIGEVSGDTQTGGFAGNNNGTINDSYFDTESSAFDDSEAVGDGDDSGVTGLTTDEMTSSDAEANMGGFDFSNIWLLQ